MLGGMSEDARSPADYAAEIDQARERLVAFADSCSDNQWHAAPLDGDPRQVGVIVDHVAHAYEYLAGWMREILDGQTVTVSGEVVDALNAEHAARAAGVTQAEVVEHLRRSGAAISQLVAGCSAEDLQADEGRVERLAQIAIRHADDHRAEIEAGLAASSGVGPG
jgi:DinB superfamily